MKKINFVIVITLSVLFLIVSCNYRNHVKTAYDTKGFSTIDTVTNLPEYKLAEDTIVDATVDGEISVEGKKVPTIVKTICVNPVGSLNPTKPETLTLANNNMARSSKVTFTTNEYYYKWILENPSMLQKPWGTCEITALYSNNKYGSFTFWITNEKGDTLPMYMKKIGGYSNAIDTLHVLSVTSGYSPISGLYSICNLKTRPEDGSKYYVNLIQHNPAAPYICQEEITYVKNSQGGIIRINKTQHVYYCPQWTITFLGLEALK